MALSASIVINCHALNIGWETTLGNDHEIITIWTVFQTRGRQRLVGYSLKTWFQITKVFAKCLVNDKTLVIVL